MQFEPKLMGNFGHFWVSTNSVTCFPAEIHENECASLAIFLGYTTTSFCISSMGLTQFSFQHQLFIFELLADIYMLDSSKKRWSILRKNHFALPKNVFIDPSFEIGLFFETYFPRCLSKKSQDAKRYNCSCSK